jgi:hypothetical protein
MSSRLSNERFLDCGGNQERSAAGFLNIQLGVSQSRQQTIHGNIRIGLKKAFWWRMPVGRINASGTYARQIRLT